VAAYTGNVSSAKDPTLRANYDPRGKQKPASPETYKNLQETGAAKPVTPNESQTTKESPRLCVAYKGSLTKSSIYETAYPDGVTKTLRIDGPADSFVCQNNFGQLILVSGKYSPKISPGSGKLCFHSYGGTQQKHERRSNYEYNAGDDPEKQALNIMCFGDVVEDAKGSERHIKAAKIMISATEELVLSGATITIQANNGQGNIQMFAGNIEQTSANKKDIVIGQVMKFGVSEESTLQFDPRASVNWVSPGHVNWKILGDYEQWVGGGFSQIIAGGLPVPPLIKVRDNIFKIVTTGPQLYESTMGIAQIAGGGIAVAAGGGVTIDAGAAFSANAAGSASMAAGSTVNITSADKINIIGVGNVKIKGALIYLN